MIDMDSLDETYSDSFHKAVEQLNQYDPELINYVGHDALSFSKQQIILIPKLNGTFIILDYYGMTEDEAEVVDNKASLNNAKLSLGE